MYIINQDIESVIADRVKELSLSTKEDQAAFDKVEFEAQDYHAPQKRTTMSRITF
jgi:hypothetical protein